MTKVTILAASAVFTLIAAPILAAPLGHPSDPTAKVAKESQEIIQVHGCNRVCELGPVPRWGGVVRWHRHVGRACEPVQCSPR